MLLVSWPSFLRFHFFSPAVCLNLKPISENLVGQNAHDCIVSRNTATDTSTSAVTDLLGIFPSYQVDHQDLPLDYVTKEIEVNVV